MLTVMLAFRLNFLWAQPEPKKLNLEEVIVTGQYEANSLSKSVYKVKIIDSKRIEAQGAFNLQQVLANELNVRILQDPILGSSMQLQGVGGNNIKVLIDGVPIIGRENGNVDLSQINLQNVERLEFIEGPMSVTYGTDALGGVINIITKKQKAKTKNYKLSSYFESIGQYNFDGSLGYSNQKYSINADFGRVFFKGYSIEPESRVKLWKPRTQYLTNLNFTKFLKDGTLRWANQYFDEKVSDKGEPNIDWTQAVALDKYYLTKRFSTTFFLDKKYEGKRNINVVFNYSYYQRQYNTYLKDLVQLTEQLVPSSSNQDTNWFHQIMSRGTYSNVALSKKVAYQLGYEFTTELALGSRVSSGKQQMSDYNLFASTELKPIKHLLIRPAFRIIYHTRYIAPLVPSINIKYDYSEALVLRGSYARGFRAPSIKELFLEFVDVSHNLKGNPSLMAETSDNIQLSATYNYKLESKVFRVEPTLFYNHISNMIDLVRVGTGNSTAFQYLNVNSFTSQGSSITLEYRTLVYQISIGYSLTGRKNKLFENIGSTQFNYANEWRLNGSYNFEKIGLSCNLFCKINGRTQNYQFDYITNKIALNYINSFTLLDMTVVKTLRQKSISITSGIKNLMNVVNVNANISNGPHSSGTNNAITGMGRSFFIGIKYNI